MDMIDFQKILTRAWHILWNYKTLWIFGLLLALTGGTSAGNGGSSGSSQTSSGAGLPPDFNPNSLPFFQNLNAWFRESILPLFLHPDQHLATLIWIGLALLLLGLLVGAVFAILRYVSEAAVIRMVSEFEQTGTKVRFKQGWKLGWSRAAFRMWLIDLLIGLLALPLVAVLLGLGFAAYFTMKGGMNALAVGTVLVSIACAFVFILAFVFLVVTLGLLSNFFKRFAALENTGVVESFRLGWEMFKRNWKSASVMWLIMLGLRIAFGIASLILLVFLIPVFVLLALPGLLVALLPALAAFSIASLFTSSPLTWIIALLVGAPFFFLVVGSPLLLIGGWAQVFSSSVWTLTYRELKALEAVALPEPAAPGQ
jgi:hypothetical protein